MNSELQKANDNIIISDMEREVTSGSYHIFVFCLNREIEWNKGLFFSHVEVIEVMKESTLLFLIICILHQMR
jgi:hypothetical protein